MSRALLTALPLVLGSVMTLPFFSPRRVVIEPFHKGFAPALRGRDAESVALSRLNLFSGSFVPPIMVLKQQALEHNINTMASYCRDAHVLLAPHGKTTLCPQLIVRQIDAGAWGITVATPSQLFLCRSLGVSRIVLANELVDQTAIAWIASEIERDPSFDFMCYVDSLKGVRIIDECLAMLPNAVRPLDVLLEVGHLRGRTGVRDVGTAIEVADAVNRSDRLCLRGVGGYEGGLGHDASPDTLSRVTEYLRCLRATAEQLIELDLLRPSTGKPIVLSAGGSAYFDLVVEELRRDGSGAEVVLRSGSYVTHDSGIYERLSPFTRSGGANPLLPAIEVWGEVLSCPEPALAIVAAGKRDLPFDEGLPTLVAYRRDGEALQPPAATVLRLNDQHAFLAIQEGSDVQAGDWVGFGISHPCTALDKWRLVPVVDADYNVVDLYQFCF